MPSIAYPFSTSSNHSSPGRCFSFIIFCQNRTRPFDPFEYDYHSHRHFCGYLYIHPLFSHLRETIGIIHQKTKEYGFQLYIGQIADQSTTQLNGLIIPLFINTTLIRFFSLAMMITTPIAGLSQSLSISLFRNFAQLEEIPKKVIYYNADWLIMCAILLNVFGGFIIGLLLSKAFLPVVPLLLPMSIAVFFQGMYQPYNLFLGANVRKIEQEYLNN